MRLEAERPPEFVWMSTFERSARRLLDEIDLRELEIALIADPRAGRVMPRTGGLRKMRWAAKGKGKRGGARVIYLYLPRLETVYMILAYGKDTVEGLTEEQRAELKALANVLKRGEG